MLREHSIDGLITSELLRDRQRGSERITAYVTIDEMLFVDELDANSCGKPEPDSGLPH